MQISCPQCSMQYVLDARLLPPGGASVQCTRCGHVFMASPQGAVPPAPKPPPAGGADRSGAQSSTQIFGGEGAGLKSTQLFAGQTTSTGSFVPQPTPTSGPLTSSGVIPPPPSIAPVAGAPRPPVSTTTSGVHPPQAMGHTRAFGAVGPMAWG
ncbi:zinc-ribbon domain-containing protein, partial [Corallococcus sp. CA047B]|uniref:zinc-ribbon domain-containing protein n=2 Tax=unclassified Corallococcus TaxID=2685029 RepID=UPI001F2BFB89